MMDSVHGHTRSYPVEAGETDGGEGGLVQEGTEVSRFLPRHRDRGSRFGLGRLQGWGLLYPGAQWREGRELL